MYDSVTPFSMPQAQWYSVGHISTFPDIGFDEEDFSQSRLCNNTLKPGCKVFQLVSQEGDANTKSMVPIEALDSGEINKNFNDQVLVFQYRGKIHAIDHVCYSHYSCHIFFPCINSVLHRDVLIHLTLFRTAYRLTLRILALSSAPD